MVKTFKKIIYVCLLANLLFLSSACKKNETPLAEFSGLPTKVLLGEEIKLHSDSILYMPYNFKVLDTLGVFNDNIGKTGFTIVNLKNGKLIKRFAFSGDKPSEFDLNAISINGAINDQSTFSVLQSNPPCKVYIYKWKDLLKITDYKPNPIYYPQKYGYINSFLLNDSTILGQFSFSKFDNKLFGITNISSNKLTTGIELPRVNDGSLSHYYEDPLYYDILKGLLDLRIRYRPGSDYEFASLSHLGAVIQIFKIDKSYNFKIVYEKVFYLPLFDLIKGSDFTKPKMLPEGRKFGFNDVAVTKDKIYTLFNGPGVTELNLFTDYMLTYNWNGKPSERFRLDRKCRCIAIDENNPKILYGLYGSTNIRIVKYKLP